MNRAEIDGLIVSLELSPLVETYAEVPYAHGAFTVRPYSTINGEHAVGYDLTEGDALEILSDALADAGIAHALIDGYSRHIRFEL